MVLMMSFFHRIIPKFLPSCIFFSPLPLIPIFSELICLSSSSVSHFLPFVTLCLPLFSVSPHIHFQPGLEALPALHEWSVRSWCLFKLDMSCVGRESDRELSSAAVALPTLEMSYVNTVHFIAPWEEIIIDVLWKGGKWDLHSGEKHMGARTRSEG